MATSIKEVTAQELLAMPDDGFRYELVRGELRKMSPTGRKHGKLAMKVGALLFQHVEKNGLGEVYGAETGFRIRTNPDTVRAPDVAFVSRERLEDVGDLEGFFPGAPDLAVEVISPHDLYGDVEDKVFEWITTGSKLVLVVNPRKRSVTAYRSHSDIKVLTEDQTLDGGEVVPGWMLALSDLFS